MSAIVRKTSIGMLAFSIAFSLAGGGWIYVELGTDLLGDRVSVMLVTLGGIAVLGGILGAVQSFSSRGCSSCDVLLARREGCYPAGAYPTFRAGLEALRAGNVQPLADLLRSPQLGERPSGSEATLVVTNGCPRCGQVAEVSVSRHRLRGNVTERIEGPPAVVIEGPAAQRVLDLMPGSRREEG